MDILILILIFAPVIYLTTKLVRRKNVGLTLVYFAVMAYMACFRAPSMDPLEDIWLVCWHIVGLALLISSIISIAWNLKQLGKKTVIIKIASIVVVVVCMLGFQNVNNFMRPRVFSLVAAQNERTAVVFMETHPQGERFWSHKFRYPYHNIDYAYVAHTNGILTMCVGVNDMLALVTPQGSTNNLPKDAKLLYGSWYIYKDLKHR